MVRADIPILLRILGESILFSTTKYDISSGGFVGALYQVEDIPFHSWFVGSFHHEKCWILSNAFPVTIKMIMYSVIRFIQMEDYIDLGVLNQLCIPRIDPIWSWDIIFFTWIHSASISLQVFPQEYKPKKAGVTAALLTTGFLVPIAAPRAVSTQ